MSYRNRDDAGGNPNKMELDDSRRFGRPDNDKPSRDDQDEHLSRFDSGRGRRPPPFGRGRRSPPPRDKSFGGRSRDYGYGRDEPSVMRERSPMRGSDDRFKKDDGGFAKREDHRKDMSRPYEDSHRDRYIGGMESHSRYEGPEFNSRFDGPNDQFKHRSMNYPPGPKAYFTDGFPRPNECEIIVVNKQQRRYAESVEARVKDLGILVDMLFLKDEALLTQTIDDIARRGSLYAMVISPQNETHGSVTVNILQGTPQEHRNMPLDDALKLVSRNFHDHIRLQKEYMERERAERGPYVGVTTDREMQFLLRMLSDGRWISLSEINAVVHYLCERRDKMQGPGEERIPSRPPMPTGDVKIEPALKIKDDTDVAQKEQDLQNRIINIMNQGVPPSATVGNTQIPNVNQGLLPNVDRSNQPGITPGGGGSMRPPQGMGSNLPGMKSSRPGLDDNASTLPGLESKLSVAESPNQAVYTSTVSGTNVPSESAAPAATYINFDNPSVQKALDNLIQSGPNLLKTLSGNSGISNPSQNVLPAKSASNNVAGMGPASDHLGINSASRGNMGPNSRGPGGIPDMGGSGLSRNSGNFDMGPPRGGGGMADIGGPALSRGVGNAPAHMASQRSGFSNMPDVGGPQRNFGGGNMAEGGMGLQRMSGGMPDMGRMGTQRVGGMGPPHGQDMGHGPTPHNMGPGSNFSGQSQFGKYGSGQQGNYSGSYNPDMSRQNYGGSQGMTGMGTGPRRY